MKILWREETSMGNESASARAKNWGLFAGPLRWVDNNDYHGLFVTHNGSGANTLLCETSRQASGAEKKDIENMARLRYAEFFEEDKCG